jgi:hypothetical protein
VEEYTKQFKENKILEWIFHVRPTNPPHNPRIQFFTFIMWYVLDMVCLCPEGLHVLKYNPHCEILRMWSLWEELRNR